MVDGLILAEKNLKKDLRVLEVLSFQSFHSSRWVMSPKGQVVFQRRQVIDVPNAGRMTF